MHIHRFISISVFTGKGKTPLRRSNNSGVPGEAAADQPVVQVLESSCEKSCQVTSEQIKADMKAAAENAKRSNCKGVTPDAVQNSARAGATTAVWGPGSAGGPTRTRAKPVTGPVGRAGPGGAPARQVGGCGSMVAGMAQRQNTSGGIDNPEGPPRAQRGTLEAGVGQNSGGVCLDSTTVTGNQDSRRIALLAGQEDRRAAPSRSAVNQHGPGACQDFVPRRPLTRSRTRLSSVPLAPETGKVGVPNAGTVSHPAVQQLDFSFMLDSICSLQSLNFSICTTFLYAEFIYLVFRRFFQTSVSVNSEKEKNGRQVNEHLRPSHRGRPHTGTSSLLSRLLIFISFM